MPDKNVSLDICAGAAGGWSLGLERAGIKTVAACEVVDWRREKLAHNFPGTILYDDLRTLTADRVRADLGAFPRFLFGSPVCKEYSSVNHRAGGLDADDLFLHAIRLAGEGRPDWCGFENSDFIKTRGYDRIAAALEAIGYTGWPLVVAARNAGAKHGRPRAFVIATDLSRPQRRTAGQSRPAGRVGGMAARRPGHLAEDAGADLPRLGPVGTASLGRHLREYDGLPSWMAERCREAYGDAVVPQVAETVARAILIADEALRLAA